ncbi:MAG TPA: adenylosuccinate lyase [Candidatus Gastranaerophilaceae bacterium]|nr:adenylosuccinate lyase [Candidatus Gastranaerophilaceae bacterium]HPT41374.1 adenylosuccinate lyase [Candidatus Gastranaerophilaceae bacterium]
MIERYSLKEMKKIWDLQSKFGYYLQVELAVCEAYSKMGQISAKDLDKIKKLAKFDLKRIDEIEKEVNHDVIAFITNINESLGNLSKYFHLGLTSSDVIDTALALQIKDAAKIINKDLDNVISSLKKLIKKCKKTVCIGRSHGVHAEIMTFGVKLCSWLDAFERVKENFNFALEKIMVGQISGPVGTYSNISPEIEKITCKILGLKPAKISTQIIARDIHAQFMQSLALIASVIERFATEIRHLQRTEVLEVEEGFKKGQKGSSAMPHKKNPITSENLCGLARVVRSNSIAALENIALWHERDISHSSAERIIFPDSTILVDFMLERFKNILDNLVIHEENMLKNTNLFGGIIYSQKVMLELVNRGLSREKAYEIVQKNALDAFEKSGNFKSNLLKNKEIKKYLSQKEIEACFNAQDYLKNTDEICSKFD